MRPRRQAPRQEVRNPQRCNYAAGTRGRTPATSGPPSPCGCRLRGSRPARMRASSRLTSLGQQASVSPPPTPPLPTMSTSTERAVQNYQSMRTGAYLGTYHLPALLNDTPISRRRATIPLPARCAAQQKGMLGRVVLHCLGTWAFKTQLSYGQNIGILAYRTTSTPRTTNHAVSH